MLQTPRYAGLASSLRATIPIAPNEVQSSHAPEFRWSLLKMVPCCLVGISGLIQTIHAVASALLGNISEAISYGAHALCSWYSAAMLIHYTPLIDLKNRTNELTADIQSMAQNIELLQKSNKTLSDSEASLQRMLSEQQAEQQRLETKHAEEISTLTKEVVELQAARIKIEQLQQLVTEIERSTQKTEEQVNSLSSLKIGIDFNSSDIENRLEEVKKIHATFSSAVTEASKDRQNLTQEVRQAESIVASLQHQFSVMNNLILSLKRERDLLKQSLDQLQTERSHIEADTKTVISLTQQVKKNQRSTKQSFDILNEQIDAALKEKQYVNTTNRSSKE